jgi:peptide/nickel transport system permease protein
MGKRGWISLVILLAVAAVSLGAPALSPHDPVAIDLDMLKRAPGIAHPFGTDQKGRDVLTRVLYGGRISLGVALLAAAVSMFTGLAVGMVSGYAGGRVDTALMAIVDLILSFPSLLLAIGISIVLPPGVTTVMVAIAAVGWASFARLIRGYVLKLRAMPYVEAARAAGCGGMRIMAVHLLPQCIPLALVMTGLKVGGYILTEASLGFLGLGAQPPLPSWGAMIGTSRSYIIVAPWMAFFPGLAITVTALAFNILGDALSERFGVRRAGGGGL